MKPSIPKGTRDFGPKEVSKRQYIFDTIRQVFVRYGYQPIETPVMENLSTLTGKYGEEGDKLLFKVLNNGDYLKDVDLDLLTNRDSNKIISQISKRGLRYDLTVPFARFVVMHQNEIAFPFKRYQIQPVWRADRPQKGRYQEFYQCDVDVVGSSSLMYEAELAQIYDEVFAALQLPVVIKINHRQILAGMAEVCGMADRFVEMTVAVDKLDKIGMDGVRKEMLERGFEAAAIDKLEQLLQVRSLDDLLPLMESSSAGQLGITELKQVLAYFPEATAPNRLEFDITLARGLNYYTGCIFEVKAQDAAMGSIGGGGRYDNLTGVFGLPNVSGVGVSFGAERIYDVMEEKGLFPEVLRDQLQLLLIAFDDTTHRYAFDCLRQIRAAGINAELYPEPTKLKKQMKYANDRAVPFVILIGEEEMQSGLLSLKNMASGEQQKQPMEQVIQILTGSN